MDSDRKLYFGHDLKNNRFGDTDLSTPFVWKKKWKKKNPKLKGKELKKMVKQKMRKREKSLEKEISEVKVLRKRRQQEKEAMDQMREDIQKQLERENYGILNQKEEQFHKEQVRERALIRIKDGRENTFDTIFKNVLFALNSVDFLLKHLEIDKLVEMISKRRKNKHLRKRLEKILFLDEPFKTIENEWNPETLKQIKNEVEEILELDENKEFWEIIEKTVKFFMSKNNFNQKELKKLLKNKNLTELTELEIETKTKIENAKNGESGEVLDFEYWGEMAETIRIFKFRHLLDRYHKKAVDVKNLMENSESVRESLPRKKKLIIKSKEIKIINEKAVEPNPVKPENGKALEYLKNVSISQKRFDENIEKLRIKFLRENSQRIIESNKSKNDLKNNLDEKLFQKYSSKPLNSDEQIMPSNNIAHTKTQNYWWQDKFRPRKPLFFNRIKTGYDWNRYNRSHYDSENPPPKIVQGYKFNVFYPDLVDIKIAPTYLVERIPNDTDFVILRFKAGAPYEDIAFKIVNKSWNEDVRGGFKSTFSNGVLQLYFNFKRYFYRR